MQIELLTGPQVLKPGTKSPPSMDEFGSLVTALVSGKFREAVLRGKVFTGGTAATGVAPGTAIGTTAAFALANPAGSGSRLVVLRAVMGYVSGTLGAGVVHFVGSLNPVAAAVTGTAITAVNALLGSGKAAAGKAFTTATLPATPTVLRPFCSLLPMLATSVTQPWQVVDEVDGEFVLEPGAALSLESTAGAGTSPLVVFGMTWEEIDI